MSLGSVSTFQRYGRSITAVLLTVSGVLLLAMMLITTVDVAGRFGFSRSLTGSTEMVRVALAFAVALSLPAVTWGSHHIALGLFQGPSSSRIERLRLGFISLVSAVTMTIVAVVLWGYAGEAAEYEDVIGYLELPVAPMVYVLSVMTAVSAAFFFLHLFFQPKTDRSKGAPDGEIQSLYSAAADMDQSEGIAQ